VQAHVRRLEALRRAGIVERIEEGLWRIPPNLPAQGRSYDLARADRLVVTMRSHLSIQQQVRAMGATWLDEQLIHSDGVPASRFGAELQQALRAREEFLIESGLAERRGQRVLLMRDLLSNLRARDLESFAKRIAGETGLSYQTVEEGERISGVYRRSVQLVSGRFAMLDDGTGFTLVPWRPAIERHLGQSLTAVVRERSVSWELGSRRGLSL
jgi:hypothetical protein